MAKRFDPNTEFVKFTHHVHLYKDDDRLSCFESESDFELTVIDLQMECERLHIDFNYEYNRLSIKGWPSILIIRGEYKHGGDRDIICISLRSYIQFLNLIDLDDILDPKALACIKEFSSDWFLYMKSYTKETDESEIARLKSGNYHVSSYMDFKNYRNSPKGRYNDEASRCIRRFLKERCVIGEGSSIEFSKLYKEYQSWIHEQNEPSLIVKKRSMFVQNLYRILPNSNKNILSTREWDKLEQHERTKAYVLNVSIKKKS